MQLWHKAAPQLQPETVYVPVGLSDARPYRDKWNDARYLRRVVEIGRDEYYRTEVTAALAAMRDHADVAKSSDELKGLQRGIQYLKSLLVVAERAEAKINEGADLENVRELGKKAVAI